MPLALLTGPTAASAAQDPTIVGHVSTVAQTISSPAVSATVAGVQPSPDVAPPSSCNWGPVTGTVTATYTDHILSSVALVWSDHISCLGTGSETMSFLRDQADAYRNTEQVKTGTAGTCVYPNTKNTPCRGVHSTGAHVCVGDLDCDGVYQFIGFETLELPSGYVWATFPKSCVTALGGREIFCSSATGTVTVPSVGG
jgi:hypothetical protein